MLVDMMDTVMVEMMLEMMLAMMALMMPAMFVVLRCVKSLITIVQNLRTMR